MDARRAVRVIAAGRAALGAAVLLAPERTTSLWLGAENARGGAVKALGRGLAARDLGLALATLQTLDDPVIGPRVQAACAFADGVDAIATAIESRSLPAKGVAGTFALAAGASAAGFYLAHRIAHEG